MHVYDSALNMYNSLQSWVYQPRQHIKKQRHSLLTKVHLVKVMVFPVVMCWSKCWTIKKAECWRTGAFELWYWRRLLRVPWFARRSNQSIFKEISPGCPLEGLMLKLKLQHSDHLIWRPDSLEKTRCWEGLGAGKEADDREWDCWIASLTRWTWVWVNPGSWWWTGRPGVLWFMGLQRVGQDWVTELILKGKVGLISFLFSEETHTEKRE